MSLKFKHPRAKLNFFDEIVAGSITSDNKISKLI